VLSSPTVAPSPASGAAGDSQPTQTLAADVSTATIGMHVRRGDACFRWAERGDSDINTRPCYKLEVYMAEARRLKAAYGVSKVAVATDSDSVIAELQAYTPEFRFVYLPFNRTLVGGPENVNMAGGSDANFIENRRPSDELKALIFATAAAEVQLLAAADFLIGTSSSTVSRLVFLTQVGRLGYVPPYVFLDRPVVCAESVFCPHGRSCGCMQDPEGEEA